MPLRHKKTADLAGCGQFKNHLLSSSYVKPPTPKTPTLAKTESLPDLESGGGSIGLNLCGGQGLRSKYYEARYIRRSIRCWKLAPFIYIDSIAPIDEVDPKPLPSTDIEEVVRRYVDKANESIIDDLLNLQAQVSELTTNRDNWDDLRADVADLREQLAKLTTIPMAKKPTIKTALTTTEPSKDIQAKINLLEDDPKLFARVKSGIEKELSNADLGQWLDDGGFRNTKDETYKIDSVSRFRRALEYLTNPKMEVRPNG